MTDHADLAVRAAASTGNIAIPAAAGAADVAASCPVAAFLLLFVLQLPCRGAT
jgi:hypothetical protein